MGSARLALSAPISCPRRLRAWGGLITKGMNGSSQHPDFLDVTPTNQRTESAAMHGAPDQSLVLPSMRGRQSGLATPAVPSPPQPWVQASSASHLISPSCRSLSWTRRPRSYHCKTANAVQLTQKPVHHAWSGGRCHFPQLTVFPLRSRPCTDRAGTHCWAG